MALLADLPRNEDGIATALGVLTQRFGGRVETGRALREQHGHTTTWLRNQPPDAVMFPETTEEVQEIVRICAEYGVPVIPFGTGTSLEGHVTAPAGGISNAGCTGAHAAVIGSEPNRETSDVWKFALQCVEPRLNRFCKRRVRRCWFGGRAGD